MIKTVAMTAILALFVLTIGCTQYHAQGAGTGAALGGAAGAMLDDSNP